MTCMFKATEGLKCGTMKQDVLMTETDAARANRNVSQPVTVSIHLRGSFRTGFYGVQPTFCRRTTRNPLTTHLNPTEPINLLPTDLLLTILTVEK